VHISHSDFKDVGGTLVFNLIAMPMQLQFMLLRAFLGTVFVCSQHVQKRQNMDCAYQNWKKKTVCTPKIHESSSGPPPTATQNIVAPAAAALMPPSNHSQRFCKVLGSPPFVAVIARWDEDVAWAQRLPMPALVYEHAKPDALYNVPINRGSESSSYVQFIIDHYACLPPWVLFLHAHGRTASSGSAHAATRHHPTDPSNMAALIDVVALNRGFIGLGHFSNEDWSKPKSLHGAARAFSAPSKPGAHHAAFVPFEERKRGCQCSTLQRIFPDASCAKPWSWNIGAEFWVSSHRIASRPIGFWLHAMKVAVSGKDISRFGHSGSSANEAGYCFESVWHAILGEPLYGFKPSFKYIEDLPRVSLQDRCKESQQAGRSTIKGCSPEPIHEDFESPRSSDSGAT